MLNRIKAPEIDFVLTLGDLHGHEDVFRRNIDRWEFENAIIIQVGDFNMGYNSVDFWDTWFTFNDFLAERNIHMYVIRGNHDNPYYFMDDPYMILEAVRRKNDDRDKKWNDYDLTERAKKLLNLSNLKLVPDYTILETIKGDILLVGGAISVDRKDLERYTPYKNWWPNEVFVYDEEKIKAVKGVRAVITHTNPSFAYPLGQGTFVHELARKDETLIQNLIAERNQLARMCKLLNSNNMIDEWHYGHFHNSHSEDHVIEGNSITFTLLNELELKEMGL